MGLTFGDLLSNALHEVKLHTRKKIGIIQDEIGYTFEPPLTGVTIESWRYRKPPSALPDLEQLAKAIIEYGSSTHDEAWLQAFLESGGHPFPEVVCQRLFPAEAADPASQPIESEENKAAPFASYPPPPLAAYAPPHLESFVGREAELIRFQKELNETDTALICGMAGMGKTTLANRLASLIPNQEKVFWHPFHDGNLNPFMRRLAGFLANHDRTDLWEMIEAARMAGIKPPTIETSLDTLVAQLDGLDVTLCLDDLQYVDDDPQFAEFMSRVQNCGIQLIITARRFPAFVSSQLQELDGLSAADTGALLAARQVELSDGLIADLHAHTAGNGAFLTLAAVMLRHATNPADLIAKLATIDNIERFLMEEVNDRLSANQQRVMEGVAILGGYPGSRDALEEILNQRDVRRTLQELSGQFLLLVADGEFGREYSQHAIIQSFYYEQPRQRVRRELHLRAAEFYDLEEVDRFKATLHYAKGDHSERATRLASTHLWEIVNQGMAKPLADILDGIQEGNLAQNDLFELWLAQAQLDTLLGDVDNAQEVLQKAADKLQALPVTAETDVLKARVCLHMAELLERQSPSDALTWAQRGLEVISQKGSGEQAELTAALNIRSGTMMMHMGNLGGALETFETVTDDMLGQAKQLQLERWINLISVHMHLSQFPKALNYANQALELSRHQRNHLDTSRIYSNVAYVHFLMGNWNQAVSALEEALLISRRLGSHNDILTLSVNLGRVYSDLGNHHLAWQHLNHALEIGEPAKAHQAMIAKINIGRLLISQNEFEPAVEILLTAEGDAKSKNDQVHIATAMMHQAEAWLGLGNFKQAYSKIAAAIKSFQQLGDSHGLGIALKVNAEISWHDQQQQKAINLLDESLSKLNGVDIYQEALAKLLKGQIELEQRQFKSGTHLIEEAAIVFKRIGANFKVLQAESVLQRDW
ncbi:MAG: tetratricopeptide repeat protein [Anaerolineae bacterium]